MQIPFVDLKAQYHSIETEILAALQNVCENTSFVLGPFVKNFEENFSRFIGTRYTLGLNSGTAAVQLAVQALIKAGDEVITAPNTFIATSEAITAAGGRVVFVDVDESTYNMNPSLLESAITRRTRVIVPVHLYGQPADMDPILEIARKHHLHVIEDAAQAHGAVYKGKTAGSLGDAAAFSFYPGKNLGAYGEAGAVTTSLEQVRDFIYKYRDHGSAEKYIHEFEGHNMRMEGFQGAVLNVKLKYLGDWNEKRRRNARRYNEHFQKINGVIIPGSLPDTLPVYHLYVIRVKDRQGLQNYLQENGVATGFHYKFPLHLQKAYSHLGYKKGDFPVAEKVMEEIISLPMYPELTGEQIKYVVELVSQFVGGQK